MTFRPFNPETLAELAAIQAEIDKLREGGGDVSCMNGLCDCMAGDCKFRRETALRRDLEAIYQADYDLSRQHR